MKKILLLLLFISATSRFQAQVVFCPPGATWKYSHRWAFHRVQFSETCSYLRDSIIGGDTVKLINSRTFFHGCAHGDTPPPSVFTLIKQVGDTIFMSNYFTQNQWQILYNFAAQPGDMWLNTLGYAPNKSYYTTFIDSVKNVSINNVSLKRLYVTQNYLGGNFNAVYWQNITTITERLGFRYHLFPFLYLINAQPNGDYCEDGIDVTALCYGDNDFALSYYTGLNCEAVAIKDISATPHNIRLFPNPASGSLTFESETEFNADSKVIIYDVYGKCVKQVSYSKTIDLKELSDDLYIVQIKNKDELLYTTKLIVQR